MYKWLKVVHIIGFLMWSGSLFACLALLRRHAGARGESRTLLSELERKFALSMDIGAALAIASGLYLALGSFGGAHNWFTVKTAAGKPMGVWLHIKLTVVVLFVALHGFTRMKVGKFRKSEDATMPAFALPVSIVLLTVIVILATVKPMSGM